MRQNKTWFFRNNDVFKGLKTTELAFLDANSQVEKFRRKAVIWETGDPSTHVYWIRMGILKMHRSALDDREHIQGFFTKGDLVGENALYSEKKREQTAVVCEDMTALSLEREAFLELGLRNPNILCKVGTVLAERAAFQARWHAFLMYRTVPARLAGLFLRLAKTFGIRDSRGIILNLKLTHREMASIIGATRETVSFAILGKKKQGLIEIQGKRVIVIEMEGVQRLLSGS